MITTENEKQITCLVASAVLFTLQYSAIWEYPLTADEIYNNSNKLCAKQEVEEAIFRLLEENAIHTYRGFYSIKNNIQAQVIRREEGNNLAAKKLPAARLAGRIIYSFPFVKFVGISGSLSKGYAEENSDFDFFIVTAENRLWICRTLLHIFKKFSFLFGQQHKFCMNYFVDETALEIEEKNNYTAIELATLIPVSGFKTYRQLQMKNMWLKHFLPNAYMEDRFTLKDHQSETVKKTFENIMNSVFANKINIALMRFTDERWRKKWKRKNYPHQDYELAFKTRINISKNHPANYQKRVLEQLRKIEFTSQELLHG